MEREEKRYLRNVALKTLAFCCALLLLVVSIFAVASPRMCSNFAYSVGAKKLSASFAVSCYKRSGDINDLAGVFERSVYANSNKKIEKYGNELMNNEYFEDYCAFVDSKTLFDSFEYSTYVVGNTAKATYENGNITLAVSVCEKYTTTYTENSAYDYLIVAVNNNNDKTGAETLYNHFAKRYDGALTVAEKTAIANDMQSLYDLYIKK